MRVLSFISLALIMTSTAYAGLSNTCAQLHDTLSGTVDGKIKNFGRLDQCLCLSDIPAFLAGQEFAIEAVNELGPAFVIAELKHLIGISPACNPVKSHRLARKDKRRVPDCRPEQLVCGVQSAWSHDAWECVYVQTELWSCGGCTTPYLGQPAIGKDCSAIHGVDDVACVAGVCRVRSCTAGYTVSADHTTCISEDDAFPHGTAAMFQAAAGMVFQALE